MDTYKNGLVWCQCRGMEINNNKYKMQDDSMGEVGDGNGGWDIGQGHARY